MTKAQEIETLTTFVHTLPKDSCLRPWLEDVLPQVESDIKTDFCVSPSVSAPSRRRDGKA